MTDRSRTLSDKNAKPPVQNIGARVKIVCPACREANRIRGPHPKAPHANGDKQLCRCYCRNDTA